MLLLQLLVLCLLASNLAELKTDPEQRHVSFDQSKERSGYTTHIFKESIPRLSSRTDLLRRERARHDYVHQVVFLIRQRNMDELIRVLHDVSDPLSTNYGQHWSGDEVANLTSNPESCEVLVSYLHAAGASVVSKTLYGDYITAAAPISVWETMFNTVFYTFHHTRRINDVRRLVSAEHYSIPVELDPHVEGALYVIDIPVETITSQSRFITEESITQDGVYSKQFLASGFITPSQLRAYYNISSSVSGSSVSTQGIFASTGSYYSPSDLLSFENTIGITQQLPISVGNHSSDSKCTADPNNCSESNLDLQYIIATSPGSPTTHWYTDDDFNSFLTSVSSLASPSLVYSISYGAPESSYASNQLSAFSILAIKLGVRGVTLVASSGDDGAVSYQVANQKNTSYCGYEPQFPASNPYITAVGATSGPEVNKTEVVCTAVSNVKTSGGGFSQYYSRPSFQDASVSAYFVAAAKAGQSPVSGYSTGGRGYPDVSLAGYHYKTLIAGNLYGLSGTSASAPTFAGFVSNVNAARLAMGKGSLGWLNPTLYANYTLFANDVTSGNNRCVGSNLCCSQGYYAAPGWDPATGLGSINYGKFQHFLLSLGTLSGNSLTDPPTQSPTFRPSPAPTSSPTTRTPTLAPTTRSPTTQTPTQSPTTRTPTTQSPTRTPTTQSPTTQSPSTQSPSTQMPSTLSPSQAPSSISPSTQFPSSQSSSTQYPSTQSPSTLSPSTLNSSTSAPSIVSPSTQAPLTLSPSTYAPFTQSPTTLTPSTLAPSIQSLSTLSPSTLSPSTHSPSSQAPSMQTPSTRTPSSQSPLQATPTHAPSTHTPTVAIMTMFRATHILSGVSLADASTPSFSIAIRASTSTMLGVPLSAVSSVTVTTNRRMLLSGVTFSYIVIIDSGHTPDYYITKVETTEYSNNLLTSLSATTGIPIDDITIAVVTDLSPTFTPTSSPTTLTMTEDQEQGNTLKALTTAAVAAISVIGSVVFLVLLGYIVHSCCFRGRIRYTDRIRNMSRIRSLARISVDSTVFPLPESNNNVAITGVAAHTFEPVAEEKAEVMNRSLSPRVSQIRQDTSINMPANSVSKSVLLTDYSFIDLYPPPKNDYQLH